MNSITIITIVVVALLTVIIFVLTWLGYTSCLKMYKMEVDAGKHDEEIHKEYHTKQKGKVKGLIGTICSYLVLTALAGLFVTGIVYKASGENFTINNHTSLVIKSGSMSGFYNEALANQYQEYGYDAGLQFGVGDICVFETTFDELVEGEVYGYKYKNIIITHRLVEIDETNNLYIFRGDNNGASDGLVQRDQIIYHYTGTKIPGLGAFILYAQSFFGIWSIVGIIGVAISSEVVYHKITKINKERNKLIYKPEPEENAEKIEVEAPKEEKTEEVKTDEK